MRNSEVYMYMDWEENLIEERMDEEHAFIDSIRHYEPKNSCQITADFAIFDGEPFLYDDAVLDSMARHGINSIDADDEYRELVKLDRLIFEEQNKKLNEMRVSGINSLIDEYLEDEKSLLDSFDYEIQLENEYEMFLEVMDEDPKPHYWDGDFPESWCDEYAPESDPFDSLDYSPYDNY